MKRHDATAAAAVLAALLAWAPSAQAARAYIGTYTPESATVTSDNHGEGIYLVDIDNSTGAPSNPRLVAKTLSPSWMVLSPDHKFLYAVNDVANFGPDKSGSVTAYAVDAASGALTQINTVSSQGAGPAYISIHPSGKFVLVANYFGGGFTVIRVKPDGSLGEATDIVKPSGPLNRATASDNPPGQLAGSDHRGSRGHMIAPDRSGRYVIGDDAGRDQIFVWKLSLDTGKLQEVSVTKALPGSAPRHFALSPDDHTLYQLQEQDSHLAVYDFAAGKLTRKGPTVSTLPAGYQGSNTGSELLISRDGRHLYAANRTQDSIAVFAAGKDGVIKTANVATEADQPRSLTLDPSGHFLYSLNQRGDNVTTFRIGPNGVPRFTGNYLAIGSAAVMVFLP
ncbi:MAG TPA: lactonase family protein [Rhizomicrobium sp.]|jgi:6-phosphogluconolactonase (cycloisomerase 2 family)|nr:lactonase family protein [Rhizomicrobium sp.]